MIRGKIIGTGSYLPKRAVSNDALSDRVDTSDEWIQQRVGIKSRHIADDQETNVFMATEAARRALEAADVSPEDVDMIVLATSTPDDRMPGTATQVQYHLGVGPCPAFDISAACSGFIYALDIAYQYIASGAAKRIVVIGSEIMSRVVDWSDRRTCVLFGDGAGAVLLEATEGEKGLLSTHVYANGSSRDMLYVPNQLPACFDFDAHIPEDDSFLSMEGNKVFKQAVTMLGGIVDEVLVHNNITKSDIDWLVPHQANKRIIIATAEKLGISMDRVVLTLPEHGNTSAASVPLAFDAAVRSGQIQPDSLVLMEAFGSGFVWGAALLRF